MATRAACRRLLTVVGVTSSHLPTTNTARTNGLCASCIEKAPDLTVGLLDELAAVQDLLEEAETTDERLAQCDEALRIARQLAAFERNGLIDTEPSAYEHLDRFRALKPRIVEVDLHRLVQDALADATIAAQSNKPSSFAETVLILDKYAAIDDYRAIALEAKLNLLGGTSHDKNPGDKLLRLGPLDTRACNIFARA